jgi:hypothetical protein
MQHEDNKNVTNTYNGRTESVAYRFRTVVAVVRIAAEERAHTAVRVRGVAAVDSTHPSCRSDH